MPGAFPQDVNEGSKHVEHESSVQGTSQMPPPQGRSRGGEREAGGALPVPEYQGCPGSTKQVASPACLQLSEMLKEAVDLYRLVPVFAPAPQQLP